MKKHKKTSLLSVLLLFGMFFSLAGCSTTRTTYNIKDSESGIVKNSDYHTSLIRTFNKLKNTKKGFIYGFEGYPMKAENIVKIVPVTIEDFDFTQESIADPYNPDVYVSISYSMNVSLSKEQKEKLMLSRQFVSRQFENPAGYFISPYSSISNITADNVLGLRVYKFWIL